VLWKTKLAQTDGQRWLERYAFSSRAGRGMIPVGPHIDERSPQSFQTLRATHLVSATSQAMRPALLRSQVFQLGVRTSGSDDPLRQVKPTNDKLNAWALLNPAFSKPKEDLVHWSRARRTATLMSALALVAGGAQECSTTAQACDVRPSVDVVDGRVRGVARAECDIAPRVHNMSLYLEYEGRRETQVRETNRIPRPGAPVTSTVYHFCLAGSWRTVVKVSGVGPDDTRFDFDDAAPRRVTEDECSRKG
jgi:hypothetical protein